MLRGTTPLFTSAAQDGVLDQLLGHARGAADGSVAVCDLDGCLLDNRPRQVAIVQEVGSREGWHELARVQAEHMRNWRMRDTLLHAGLDRRRIRMMLKAVEDHWWKCFFTSEYAALDLAMPGAARLVGQLQEAGIGIVYLTGRPEEMRPGTEAVLRRFGFPLDDGGAELMMKPSAEMEDRLWKGVALPKIAQTRRPVLFMDNEPANIYVCQKRATDALCVFVETSHSETLPEPGPEVLRLRGFLRTDDHI